jgi:hypothetical protein
MLSQSITVIMVANTTEKSKTLEEALKEERLKTIQVAIVVCIVLIIAYIMYIKDFYACK